MANSRFDPEGGLVRLEDPVTFAERMRSDVSKRWPLVQRALSERGYATIEDLKAARTVLAERDPAWWQSYQGSFPEHMGACPK